ncbi:L-serine ammonia-lyase [Neoconidiobolus thromboides FSU 785]|nr:L-serine ammonia-lyase [Neoconidiobolus thromboides FSU 785]
MLRIPLRNVLFHQFNTIKSNYSQRIISKEISKSFLLSQKRVVNLRYYTTTNAQSNEKENATTEENKTRLIVILKDQEETHHAVVSTFDLFSIGVGPSSSHTVGPMRAGKIFISDLVKHQVLEKVQKFRIDLYGSLALTGIGHGTPNACLMGVEGESPESVETSTIISRVQAMKDTQSIKLNGTHRIQFDPDKDLVFHYFDSLPQHPNGMRFTAMDFNGDMIATNEYFSVGGGFVVNEATQLNHGENVYYRSYDNRVATSGRRQQDAVVATLPFTNAEHLLEICSRENMTIAQAVYENELRWRSPQQIKDSILAIWQTMDDSIRNGCLSDEPYLPGRLKVKRRAPNLYRRLTRGLYDSTTFSRTHNNNNDNKMETTANLGTPGLLSRSLEDHPLAVKSHVRAQPKRMVLPALDYLSVYAIAVNEENAAGGRVVTAPTNGAAGVIPAVLKYYLEFISMDPERDIMEFMLTASAIGMLFKKGASISAAEVGCQGEVGVACSMSAAGFAAVMGGTVAQVENAAEIGMEHNLGLTCDPIDGLVQIPCIERNALGAVKAVTAAQLALNGDGHHRVTLDQVIHTMKMTGMDMMSKYKETSQGGLAVNVPVC